MKPLIQVSQLCYSTDGDSVEWSGSLTFDGWETANRLSPRGIKEPLTKVESEVLQGIVARIQGKKKPVPEPIPVGEEEVIEP